MSTEESLNIEIAMTSTEHLVAIQARFRTKMLALLDLIEEIGRELEQREHSNKPN